MISRPLKKNSSFTAISVPFFYGLMVDKVLQVVFSNFTNHFLATYHQDRKIRLFDFVNFACVNEIKVEEPLSHLQFTYHD
jgi:hypothetical protein